jgi:hypothetical protein
MAAAPIKNVLSGLSEAITKTSRLGETASDDIAKRFIKSMDPKSISTLTRNVKAMDSDKQRAFLSSFVKEGIPEGMGASAKKKYMRGMSGPKNIQDLNAQINSAKNSTFNPTEIGDIQKNISGTVAKEKGVYTRHLASNQGPPPVNTTGGNNLNQPPPDTAAQIDEALKNQGNVNTGGSGGSTTKSQNPLSRVGKYMEKKYSEMYGDIESVLNSGENLNEDVLKSLGGRARLGEEQMSQFIQRAKGKDIGGAMDLISGNHGNFVGTPGMMDNMMAHKVPHLAAGGVSTAYLVSSMSSSKGKQSNAELYGQRSPYQ